MKSSFLKHFFHISGSGGLVKRDAPKTGRDLTGKGSSPVDERDFFCHDSKTKIGMIFFCSEEGL
jgi:hypothetical protein